MARKTARTAAMQMIFERLSGGEGGDDTLRMIYDELRSEGTEADSEAPNVEDRAWIETVLRGVLSHQEEIDSLIAANSKKWALNRMPRVDLTIMRLAVWEILYEEDVPGRVAINEAVEIANRYGNSDSSGSFINGVLGSIYRDWEKKQKASENPQ